MSFAPNLPEDDFNLSRFIGQTVTVFILGGGLSGSGFTGVLISANNYFVKLLLHPGSAPATPFKPPTDISYHRGCKDFSELGSIAVIPTDRISAFIHNNL